MAFGIGSCSVDDSGRAAAVAMGRGLGRGCVRRCADAVVVGDGDGEASERSAALWFFSIDLLGLSVIISTTSSKKVRNVCVIVKIIPPMVEIVRTRYIE